MAFTIESNDTAEDGAIQSVWYDVDLDAIQRAMSGVGVLTGCEVTAQGSPDMTVAVAAGTIQPSTGAAAVSVTSGNVTVGAAHASLRRLDIITVSPAGVKTITAGPAAASPKPPQIPSGHVYLAMIYVPATATAITTARITDKRFMLPSALIAQSYLGTTSPGASYDTGASANRLFRAKKVTLAAAGLIASIGAYVKGDATRAGIYAVMIWQDNAGVPGSLRAAVDSSEPSQMLLMKTTPRFLDVPIGFWATAGDWWIGLMWYGNVGGTAFQPNYAAGGSDYEGTVAGGWDVDTLAPGSNNYTIRATVIR